MKKFLGLIIAFLILGCAKDDKIEKDIAGIDIEVALKRFDRAFAEATPDSLSRLKSEYPYLFPKQYPDSVWIERMTDTLQQELSEEVLKTFPDLEAERAELHSLFQHIKFYFPEFKAPQVVTVISDVDYRNNVVYADSLLLISLDTYLGEEHKFYQGIQTYIKKNFAKEQIVVDVASLIAKSRMMYPEERTFLSQMIVQGKELYLKDKLIPFKTDAQKMGYSNDEYAWTETNENEIWRYFVENSLLFSTDSKLQERFIDSAPFSKFYLELDSESPGRVGQYIGWQIVRAYMKNNDVSLQKMLNTSAEEIFKSSRYKPKK